MKIFIRIVFVIFGGFIGLGVYLSNQIMYIKKKSDEIIVNLEISNSGYSKEAFDSLAKELISINSPFGYKLSGYLFQNNNSNKYMIICHGVTVSHINSIKYAQLFLKLGFNVIIYDHRRHGKTGGRTTGYGYFEKKDLEQVIKWTKDRFGSEIVIGLHGESMGAATILQYGGTIEDNVNFYIADCPFSNFEELITYRVKEEINFPKIPLVPLASLLLKLRAGYRLKEISPIDAVRNIQHPILFIHSKEDAYIPVQMSKDLYDATDCEKHLFIAEYGGHARSYMMNREEYEREIEIFLQKYQII